MLYRVWNDVFESEDECNSYEASSSEAAALMWAKERGDYSNRGVTETVCVRFGNGYIQKFMIVGKLTITHTAVRLTGAKDV